MTGYQEQDNALRTRFDSQWASRTPVAWPNVSFNPPDADSWVRFFIHDTDSSQVSMGDPGNNVTRHEGVLFVMIFTLAGQGDKEALDLADQVAAIFRGWQSPGTGLRFLRPPHVRRVGSEQKWYHLNVLIPFQRDAHF